MRSSSRDTGAGAHPVRIPWACADLRISSGQKESKAIALVSSTTAVGRDAIDEGL